MDASLWASALSALVIITEPMRLVFLFSGVVVGLVLGIIPGIGGLVGMALLLPFTFTMDPFSAFAILLGMSAVTGTSDTVPAVLFGVPGTTGAQATVMDGHAMARNGEAGRALSAAYTASLVGGLIGAAALAVSIPLLRPFILSFRAPELLALSIFGISMVAILSGNTPLKGLATACIGIALSMIGQDPQTGILRWHLETNYLWEGLPLVPIVLGVFALPEIADLVLNRTAISRANVAEARTSVRTGMRDVRKHWWLTARSGVLGAVLGAIPGLGASVVDWLVYGHARQTEKGAQETFGTGDIRGVIAPESANNALTAGSLVPTVAFGVPGSASMAILLGAFLIQGITPGPEMLTTNLNITYSMIWSIALANILGACLCLMFSNRLSRIARIRYTLIVPAVTVIIFIGAYQASRQWGDIIVLLVSAIIGWNMKQLNWPRPPLILGFVLGAIIERYLFITMNRYGINWVFRPVAGLLLVCSMLVFLLPTVRQLCNVRVGPQRRGGHRLSALLPKPQYALHGLFGLLAIYLLVTSADWPRAAQIGPQVIGGLLLVTVLLSYVVSALSVPAAAQPRLPARADLARMGYFLGFILFLSALVAVVGVFIAIPTFIIAFMLMEKERNWRTLLLTAASITLFVYLVFDVALNVPWPIPLL